MSDRVLFGQVREDTNFTARTDMRARRSSGDPMLYEIEDRFDPLSYIVFK
jgi:hypothetical protein